MIFLGGGVKTHSDPSYIFSWGQDPQPPRIYEVGRYVDQCLRNSCRRPRERERDSRFHLCKATFALLAQHGERSPLPTRTAAAAFGRYLCEGCALASTAISQPPASVRRRRAAALPSRPWIGLVRYCRCSTFVGARQKGGGGQPVTVGVGEVSQWMTILDSTASLFGCGRRHQCCPDTCRFP